MGINRALISRLGFALALARLEPAQSRDYVTARLRAVGVHADPFEDQALELLIQAASGLPRAINHLAQRAIEAAAATATPTISATHVQAALDRWAVAPSFAQLQPQSKTSPDGLSDDEARQRLVQYGYNELPEKQRSPFLEFCSHFWGPIPWMIEAAAILSAVVAAAFSRLSRGMSCRGLGAFEPRFGRGISDLAGYALRGD